ncbi:uncharacterized protein LOC124373210, partial [Homalodisca vitripennis]|uniref:uncharacterized protein LOC124373210 n=1 Tax=Homalodisca vitripennis TaxID=197043 RepID=UPI001EEAAEC1
EPFNLEYDMSKLPPSVRTYVLLKGVTENEIYEFSGARVAYVDEKNHILIQATTQKSVNMAISLIVALIKEGFDSLLVQRTKTEVETEPGLESNIPTLVKENSQGETTTEPAKKPAVEEIQSQHFEMEYEINDLPLNVRTHIMLRGVVENRVTSASGASVRTEGSYVVPQNKKYSKTETIILVPVSGLRVPMLVPQNKKYSKQTIIL